MYKDIFIPVAELGNNNWQTYVQVVCNQKYFFSCVNDQQKCYVFSDVEIIIAWTVAVKYIADKYGEGCI